jgi:hypothetical protein
MRVEDEDDAFGIGYGAEVHDVRHHRLEGSAIAPRRDGRRDRSADRYAACEKPQPEHANVVINRIRCRIHHPQRP